MGGGGVITLRKARGRISFPIKMNLHQNTFYELVLPLSYVCQSIQHIQQVLNIVDGRKAVINMTNSPYKMYQTESLYLSTCHPTGLKLPPFATLWDLSMNINHNIYLSWHFLPEKFHSNFQALKVSSRSYQFTNSLTKPLICPLTMGNRCDAHIAGNQNYGLNRQVIHHGAGTQPSKTQETKEFLSQVSRRNTKMPNMYLLHIFILLLVFQGFGYFPSNISSLPTNKMAGLFAVTRIQEQQLFLVRKAIFNFVLGYLR